MPYYDFPEVEPERNPEPPYRFGKGKILGLVLLVLAICLITALIMGTHIFEDGFFGVGGYPYTLKGCLPWGICS